MIILKLPGAGKLSWVKLESILMTEGYVTSEGMYEKFLALTLKAKSL